MTGKYQVLLDFLINMKSDPTQINKMISDVESKAKALKLDINSDQARQAILQIVQSMNSMEGEGQSFAASYKKIMTQLEESFGKLGKGGNPIPKPTPEALGAYDTLINKIQSTQTVLDIMKKKMMDLSLGGDKGSPQFTKLKADIIATEKELNNLNGTAKKTQESLVPKGSGVGNTAFMFNQTLMAAQALSHGLESVINQGERFEKQLLAVGAFTGTSGAELEKLGEKARELGISFASVGDAPAQLEIFSAVLSKMGPAYAKNSDAMKTFATNANILAKAGSIDVKDAVNVMTNSMLQFGLRTGDAAKDAEKSTEIINALAQSARSGAAQIPQVGEAILQVGVMAKGAGMSFNDTAAAIQVMSVGGKTGAEAGTALRNVIGLMQRPTMETESALKSMGLTSTTLADTLTTKGIGAAIEYLKGGMEGLATKTQKNSALMKIFGMENASAAGIFMDNIDRFKTFQEEIGSASDGMGTAFDMYIQKSGTASSTVSKMKAVINDMFIDVQQGMGKAMNVALMTSTQVAPMIMSFGTMAPMLSGVSKKFSDLGLKVLSLIPGFTATAVAESAAGTAGVTAGTAVSVAWGPVLLALLAVTAAGVGVYALMGGFKKSAEAKLEDAKATEELIASQKKENLEEQKAEESKLSLIARYDQLSKKENQSAEDKDKLNDMTVKLASAYPELNLKVNEHAQNLDKVKNAAGVLKADYSKLTEETRSLITVFATLGDKENKSAEEKKKLKYAMGELQKIYPGVKLDTNNFAESLASLKNAAGLSNDAIRQLQQGMKDYDQQAIDSAKNTMKMQVNVDVKEVWSAFSDMKGFLDKMESLDTKTNLLMNAMGKGTKLDTYFQSLIDKVYNAKDKDQLKQVNIDINKFFESFGQDKSGAIINAKSKLKTLVTDASVLLEAGAATIKKAGKDTGVDEDIFGIRQRIDQLRKQIEDKLVNARQQAKEIQKISEQIGKERTQNVQDSNTGIDKPTAEIYNKQLEELKKQGKKKSDAAKQINTDLMEMQKKQDKLKAELELQALEDSEHTRAIAEQKIKNKEAEDNAKIDVKKVQDNLKSMKGASAVKIKEQQDALVIANENYSDTVEKGNKALEDLQAKFNLKYLEKEKKKNDEIIKDDIYFLNRRIEYKKKEEQNLSGDGLIQNLKEQSDLRIEVLKKETLLKTSEYLKDNSEYKDALAKQATLTAQYSAGKISILDFANQSGIVQKTIDNLKTTDKKIFAILEDSDTAIVEETKKTTEAIGAITLKSIDEQYRRQLTVVNKFLDVWNKAQDKNAEEGKKSSLKSIDDKSAAELRKLETLHTDKLVSDEDYEVRRAKIESDATNKRDKIEKDAIKKKEVREALSAGIIEELDARRLKKLAESGNLKEEDISGMTGISVSLDKAKEIIEDKGASVLLLANTLGTSVQDALTGMMAGDPDAIAENARKFFGMWAGILQKKASAFILDLILSPGNIEFLSGLPFPANILAIPIIQQGITGAVKMLTDPILQSLFSFTTGGRIDSPTMMIAGDGARLGAMNREWIFNDPQLKKTMEMTINNSNVPLLNEIRRLNSRMGGQQLVTTLKGSDIQISLKRTEYNLAQRMR